MVSMKCISENELEDKLLLAYLDGEADQETVHHLEQCAFCLERANTLARLHDRLTKNLFRAACPSSLELGEYHLRVLPASQMMIISQHLRNCPHCARESKQLKFFLSDPIPTQDNSLVEQARVVIARLVGGKGEPKKSGKDTLIPSFTVLRGEIKEPLTFEAKGIVIVLDLQPATDEEGITMLGQIAADEQDDWTGAVVELYQNDQLEISTTVDDLGSFQLKGLLSGSREMHLIPKSGAVIVVPTFNVSE